MQTENIPLTEDGRTTIRVEVTSTDGKNTQTYTVVIRQGLEAPARVQTRPWHTLSLSDVDAYPRFQFPPSRSYTATVKYGEAEVLPE